MTTMACQWGRSACAATYSSFPSAPLPLLRQTVAASLPIIPAVARNAPNPGCRRQNDRAVVSFSVVFQAGPFWPPERPHHVQVDSHSNLTLTGLQDLGAVRWY
jgi:hypothetical protein